MGARRCYGQNPLDEQNCKLGSRHGTCVISSRGARPMNLRQYYHHWNSGLLRTTQKGYIIPASMAAQMLLLSSITACINLPSSYQQANVPCAERLKQARSIFRASYSLPGSIFIIWIEMLGRSLETFRAQDLQHHFVRVPRQRNTQGNARSLPHHHCSPYRQRWHNILKVQNC